MDLQQVFGTWCEPGPGSDGGMRANAASSGLTAAQVEAVMRLGACAIPPGCTSDRTAVDQQNLAPCLLHQRMADGSSVVAQSRCVGAGVAGGQGTFFVHALVAPPTAMPLPRLPIELWRSPDWVSVPNSEKQLSLAECPRAGPTISPAGVVPFLQDHYRIERLETFLTCVQVAIASGRRVVVVDESDAVARWIAAICYLLPPSLARSLAFYTHATDPHEVDALVIGTTADVVRQFSEADMEQAFFVLDYVGWRKGSVPPPTSYASRATEATRAGRLDAFRQVGELMDAHVHGLSLADLDFAFVYCALATGAQPGPFDPLALLAWLAHRLEDFHEEGLESVLRAILGGARNGDAASDAVVVLYERAMAIPGLSVLPTVERLFLEWLFDSAPGCPADWLQALLDRIPCGMTAKATSLGDSWFVALEKMEEPLQRLVFLKIVDRFGILDNAGPCLVGLGEKIVGPLLPDGTVARYFAELASRAIGPDILNGVGRYLDVCARANDGKTFARMAWALRREDWLAAWRDQAREERRPLLLLRLAAVKAAMAPERRFEFFSENLDLACQWVEPSAQELVSRAYGWVWGGAMPTLVEARGLLEKLADQADPEIVRDASKCLAKCVEASPTQEGLVELARLLQRYDEKERGPEARIADVVVLLDGMRSRSLEATGACGRGAPPEAGSSGRGGEPQAGTMGGGDEPEADSVKAVLKCATGPLPPALEKELVHLLAEEIVRVRAHEQHRTLVERAWHRPGFGEAYGARVESRLDPANPGRLEFAALLFRMWARAEGELVDEPWATLLGRLLPRGLPEWTEEDRQRLEGLLANDEPSAAFWSRWNPPPAPVAAPATWMGRLLARFKPPGK